MALSKNLISDFVKATTDDKKTAEETTLYGTIVEYNGSKYVRLDGSDMLTPYTATVAAKAGERVRVSVGKHSATVTGNVSSPAARTGDVEELGQKVDTFDAVVANKATIKDLEVERARVDDLVADNVVIKNQLTADSAEIKDLIADNVDIKGKLTARDAEIENLKANKIDAEDVSANYATIKNLEATQASVKELSTNKANITDLTAATGRIDNLESKNIETDKLVAKKADIDLANVNNAWINKGVLKDGSIGSAAIHEGAVTNAKIADATIEAAKIKSINADSIVAGTIKTERLIIAGPDGQDSIVKAINIANGVSEAEVNGRKIQAASIDVVDLSAFEAKIAGFDMNRNAIYSGKESIKDPNSGIYISTNGIGMGNGALTGKNESPLQAYADGSFRLIGKNSKFDFNTVTGEMDVEVSRFRVASKSVATKDDIDDIKDELVTTLKITSSNGVNFDSANTSPTLTVVIYYGHTRIVDSKTLAKTFGSEVYLEWSYRKNDTQKWTTISLDDTRIGDKGFSFYTSKEDVINQTAFRCQLLGGEHGPMTPDQETVIDRLEIRLKDYVDGTLMNDVRNNFESVKEEVIAEMNKDAYISKIEKNEKNIADLQDVIKDLQYAKIEITSFESDKKVVELGSTVTDITFSWKINKTPSTLKLNGKVIDSKLFTYKKTGMKYTSQQSFTLEAIDERNASVAKTIYMYFYNGVYYGTAKMPDTVDTTFIKSLQKNLQNTKNKTFNVLCGEDTYIWYALPTRYGVPIFNVGGFDGGFQKVADIEFKNSSGYSESYTVYKSDNSNLGTKTVTVS
nr:MAG TPA: hypothetical protein [Siphoviridae sp. ctIbi23]